MPELLGYTAPRVFTPPRRELTPETSHGFAAVAFAEQMLHMKLFPWQEWLLIHALELKPDGTYRWRVVVVEVARQSGKTMMLIVLALWHLYALKSRTVIGTAQDLANAEKVWKEAVALAQADDELAEMIPSDGIYLGHPKQFQIVHNEDGRELTSEYRIASATRRGPPDRFRRLLRPIVRGRARRASTSLGSRASSRSPGLRTAQWRSRRCSCPPLRVRGPPSHGQ